MEMKLSPRKQCCSIVALPCQQAVRSHLGLPQHISVALSIVGRAIRFSFPLSVWPPRPLRHICLLLAPFITGGTMRTLEENASVSLENLPHSNPATAV